MTSCTVLQRISHILLICPFICSFFLSPPTKIYITDSSAPVEARVFGFCIQLEGGQVYCVKENQGANIYFAFCFIFSFFTISHSYVMAYGPFPSKFSKQQLDLVF